MRNKLFLAGMLLICIIAAASILFYNQRQQEMKKIRSLEEKIQTISAERVMVAKKIKEAKEKKQGLQSELDMHNKKVQLLQADISETRQRKEELLEELSKKEKVISGLENKLKFITRQESELNSQLAKAKSNYQGTVQKIETARKEKIELEENIKARISAPGGVELKKVVVKLTPSLEGKILDVNKEYNFAVINLGIKDNIKSGDVFGIYRKDRLIAKAVAENIYEDMSSIIVLDEWLDVPILIKDTVRLLTS